ncbi:cellulose biosynthesis protein BcsQ [Rhodoferax sp.]|uniref:cellulose biosynthesis protein BcsQ n=2 Tax=Rhodoferax sp. TaxID=50421 RepID=UPI00260657E2|nr:cellulose biosynthesis protein BcsQ [Rhodoferax sp.]MDD5481007.1 cellulose biosynthesis protein BcsQ [Rhodoferax sp.]
MSIIGVVSMKGGVGKTSTCANLAAALGAQLGAGRVSTIDLDPQNALHWHFGLVDQDTTGVCEQSLTGGNWRNAMLQSAYQVACLPYGNVSEADREAFEGMLTQSPQWLASQIKAAGWGKEACVVVDTPPGPSVYLKQVFDCADLVLIVLLPDAGSYATIPDMEIWLEDMLAARPKLKVFYLLNQIDRSEALNRDTAAFLRRQLKPRMCPVDIHNDEAVAEALAFQQPVLSYEPHGQASHDFTRLAAWAQTTLNP